MEGQEMLTVLYKGKEVGVIPAKNEQLHRDIMARSGEGQHYHYVNKEALARNLAQVSAIKENLKNKAKAKQDTITA